VGEAVRQRRQPKVDFWDAQTTLAVATKGFREALRQDEFWTDASKTRRLVDHMDPDHRQALLRYLENRAGLLHKGEVAEWMLADCPFNGEHAQDAWWNEFDYICSMEAIDWLKEQPLVQKLEKLCQGN
jgi:hypothetical protein